MMSEEYQAGYVGKTVVGCYEDDLLDQFAQKLGVQKWLSTSEVDLLQPCFC